MIIFDLNNPDILDETPTKTELSKDSKEKELQEQEIVFERESLQVININGEIVTI